MSPPLASELVSLLMAGLFGALIGWYLRRLLIEEGVTSSDATTLREELAARDRDLATLQGRFDALTVRNTLTENDLHDAREELGDRERHVRELEADLTVAARNSERALRSDDEIAALREGIRRAEAARRAADDARASLEDDLEGARREIHALRRSREEARLFDEAHARASGEGPV